MLPLPGLRPVLVVLLFLLSSALLHAQATPTASRNFSASAFTGVSIVKTDRQATTNPGFSFGGDLGYFLPHGFIPSIEARMKIAPGTWGMNTYGGGVRLQHRLYRAQLYANFLWSYGTISEPYNGGTVHDNSIVYSPGGGVDIPINEAVAARFDYQYEYWHTGAGVSFNPQAFTFGVVYRFPMRPYWSH
jgi:opacity protein-like surface antigen